MRLSAVSAIGGYDDFSANTLGSYTQYADNAGTWSISGGFLTGSGGVQSVLIRNGVSFKDGEIVANIKNAWDAGLVLRFIDNNNYYLCIVHDSAAGTSNLLYLFKRVGGTFTQLTTAEISFPAGTLHQVKFRAVGTTLQIDFDGVNKISVTDSAIAGPGGCGLRHYGAGGIFDDFKWL